MLELLLRSRRACHHPIHTSIRPPARLSVTVRSPTSSAKPFISGLAQVLASIWHTAHVCKHVKYEAACCCTVCLCQCLFMGYGTLFLLYSLMTVTSHQHCLCTFHCACRHSFNGGETKAIIEQVTSVDQCYSSSVL